MSKDKNSSKEEEGEATNASGTSLLENLDAITCFLSEKLSLKDKRVLEECTVDSVVKYIQSGKCKNIITMVGAGISTSAGIPDFRSPGTGLYNNLQKYNLKDPELIFTLDFFHINAKPFFELAKDLYPGSFRPTKSHYFIKLLQEKQFLLRHYTQNIDTLERVAGITEDKLVEAHGSFHVGHCLGCRKEYSQEWMKEIIFRDEIPICEKCPGVVKPDIVFFGENLPKKFFKCNADFKKCDLLIIMGSSLVVHPFASLIDKVPSSCPRMLINLEKAGGMQFDKAKNCRDVLMLGDCDEQCQILADKLGWADELKELMESELAKIDAAEKKKNSKI